MAAGWEVSFAFGRGSAGGVEVGDHSYGAGLKEWSVWRGWFHQQRGVDVKVKRRKARAEDAVVELGDWAIPQQGKQFK